MTLGTYTPLRALCIERKMSRAQLAEKAGLTRQAIYNLEYGLHRASDETILALANALGVEPGVVLDALERTPLRKAAA